MGSLSYPEFPTWGGEMKAREKWKRKYHNTHRKQTRIPTELFELSRAIVYASLCLLVGVGRGKKWLSWWQSNTRTTLLSLSSILLPSLISMAPGYTPLFRFLTPPISLRADDWFYHGFLISMQLSQLGIAKKMFLFFNKKICFRTSQVTICFLQWDSPLVSLKYYCHHRWEITALQKLAVLQQPEFLACATWISRIYWKYTLSCS